jgi:uncharacterized protein YyaL (SSP411 family)
VPRPLDAVAEDAGVSSERLAAVLARARTELYEARAQRVWPARDDKVLTAWNGLMISAYARGARVLNDDALARRAELAAEFVWTHLRDAKTGALERRWREGDAGLPGQLDDYAYYALGLIDLYGATHDPKWLARATTLTEATLERFWDDADGAFFESPAGDPHIRVRMKDGFDGAEMAGNSIALGNLELLGRLLDRREWLARAERGFTYYSGRLDGIPGAMPQMLVAMDLARSTPRHVVIAGDPTASDTRAMITEFNRRFLPHDLLLVADGGAAQRELAKLAGFVAPLAARDGKATAYVCVNYACQLPTTNRVAFASQLDERPSQLTAKGKH